MPIDTSRLPELLQAASSAIEEHAEEVTALDVAIGDGDHVVNLQRGLAAVVAQGAELSRLEWAEAWQKIGMTLMTTMGGASGSLLGTLFVSMARAARGRVLSQQGFAEVFAQGVAAVKQRGKAEAGEKTLLDVLVPVAETLQRLAARSAPLAEVCQEVNRVAEAGAEATRDMVATKGRASFLGERSRGHLDAGAKTSQLMIGAVLGALAEGSAAPA